MKKMTVYQPIHKETEGAIVPPNVKSGVRIPEAKEAQAKIENAFSFGLPNGFQLDENLRAYKEKGFVKNDSGKLQWSLLPFNELKDVVKALMLGARKYTPDNWKKCDDVTRYKDALMRHVISYICGETIDDESHISHLAHAVCNCLFLMYFDNTKKEE